MKLKTDGLRAVPASQGTGSCSIARTCVRPAHLESILGGREPSKRLALRGCDPERHRRGLGTSTAYAWMRTRSHRASPRQIWTGEAETWGVCSNGFPQARSLTRLRTVRACQQSSDTPRIRNAFRSPTMISSSSDLLFPGRTRRASACRAPLNRRRGGRTLKAMPPRRRDRFSHGAMTMSGWTQDTSRSPSTCRNEWTCKAAPPVGRGGSGGTTRTAQFGRTCERKRALRIQTIRARWMRLHLQNR